MANHKLDNQKSTSSAVMQLSFILAICIFAAARGRCEEITGVLKSAQADAMFAKTRHSLHIITAHNYSVLFQVTSGTSAREKDLNWEEIWFVRHGQATLIVGGRSQNAGTAFSGQRYDLASGDIVHLPSKTIYQINSGAAGFEYVAVRIIPRVSRSLGIGTGSRPVPNLVPTVVHKPTLDIKYANAGRNTVLYSGGGVFVVYVVAPPSWPRSSVPEAHKTCDDFYSVRFGTARIALGGTIINAKEEPAGEIHGTNAVGAHEYTIGPDDLVSIPRNTMHHVLPLSSKFSYVLVKTCD